MPNDFHDSVKRSWRNVSGYSDACFASRYNEFVTICLVDWRSSIPFPYLDRTFRAGSTRYNVGSHVAENNKSVQQTGVA